MPLSVNTYVYMSFLLCVSVCAGASLLHLQFKLTTIRQTLIKASKSQTLGCKGSIKAPLSSHLLEKLNHLNGMKSLLGLTLLLVMLGTNRMCLKKGLRETYSHCGLHVRWLRQCTALYLLSDCQLISWNISARYTMVTLLKEVCHLNRWNENNAYGD